MSVVRKMGWVLGIVLAWYAPLAGAGKGLVTVKPLELHTVLANPGIGLATLGSFNEDPRNEGAPPSGVAYWYLTWEKIEPEQGKIRFDLIDSLIQRGRQNGQSLALRVRTMGGNRNAQAESPEWLRKLGAKVFDFEGTRKGWAPDYTDPVFQEHHERLLKALGERYNGHPDISYFDIGTVGAWGEWNPGGTGLPVIPPETDQRKIINWYFKYFNKTPLVMLTAQSNSRAYAVSNGAGWRADCLGDMGGDPGSKFYDDPFARTFLSRTPMMISINERLDATHSNDAWKRGPVVFQTCWTMADWYKNGWNADWILNEALKWHVSVVDNKSSQIPPAWRPILDRFLKRAGYRFVLRELAHHQEITAGSNLLLDMQWSNIGVAPVYRPYKLAVALQGQGQDIRLISAVDLRTWLPGEYTLLETFKIPADIPAGEYSVCVGLLDVNGRQPAVQLAIEGKQADGWYKVSGLTVVNDLEF